jgi:carboxypeptidase C (cathepsin A)
MLIVPKKSAVVAVLRIFAIALIVALVCSGGAQAQNQRSSANRTDVPRVQIGKFSQSYTTKHELALPDRKIEFTATAENLVFTEPNGFPRAEITYVAYTKSGADPAKRPIAFIVNGGPGASSAYLNLLALGPWRIPLDGSRYPASLSTLQPNAETWLDFTDLVFIDPPGTGYSRVTGNEKMQQYFRSVDGDISILADFIRRWLKEQDRQRSPIYFVGASYGGFRAPLLARKLQTETLKGFNGLILVSPALDFDLLPIGRAVQYPWVNASILPSLVALRAERSSTLTAELLQEAEAYASGEYISDLLRGAGDAQAIERIASRVEQLTGIQASLTKLFKGRVGRVDIRTFNRSLGQAGTSKSGNHNNNGSKDSVGYPEDYDLEKITSILSTEADEYFKETLKLQSSEKYIVLNNALNPAWRWGNGRYGVESLSSLEKALDADREMRVLIAHGATDMTTPYFATKMLAAQLEVREPSRLDLKVYGGNHMFYTRQTSRKAFRADAQAFFETIQSGPTLIRQ